MDVIDEVLKFDPGMRSSRKKTEDPRIDEILKFDPGPGTSALPSVAGEPSTPVGGTFVPTGEVSTITGKPVQKFAGAREPEASFWSQMKASIPNDPYIKAKIFSEARGIPITRYRVNKQNQVEFKDNEGKWQREVFELPTSKVSSLAAETLGHPSSALGPLGAAVGGVPGAVGGAMLGEGIRKGIAKYVFGEKPGTVPTLIDVGMQGVLALGGEMAGKVIGAGINKGLARKVGVLIKAGQEVQRDLLTPQEHAEALFIRQLADQHNIQLAPHQIYDKEGMTNTWKYLRKHPVTADAVRKFEDRLAMQTDEAIEGFIKDMGGYEKAPYTLGKEIRGAAEKAIDKSVARRKTIASKIYQKAFSESPEVDIKPVIDFIDSEAANAKGPVFDSLQRAKSLLLKPNLPKKTPAGALVDEFGNPLTPATVEYDTSLLGLHHSKMALDDLIEGARQSGLGNTVKRNFVRIKEMLLEQMDAASPEYAKAREKFAKLSVPIDRLRDSVIGELEQMQKDSVIAKAPGKLLNIQNMPDAQLVTEARKAIGQRDPDLWRQMVGGYVRDVYEELKTSQEGKILNAAGKLQQRLFGSDRQRQIMRAAMTPDEYRQFDGLMTIFQRAAIGTRHESMTAPFLQIERDLQGQLGSRSYQLASHPKQALVEWSLGKWNDIILSGRQQDLLGALTSRGAVDKISQMRKLTPGSRKLIESFAVFTAEVGDKLTKERP